jgi:hypothetical protein
MINFQIVIVMAEDIFGLRYFGISMIRIFWGYFGTSMVRIFGTSSAVKYHGLGYFGTTMIRIFWGYFGTSMVQGYKRR